MFTRPFQHVSKLKTLNSNYAKVLSYRNMKMQAPILPPLSKEIPSYLGPSHWTLTDAHKPYKTTKMFTKDTAPIGITSRHHTKKEVTGLIHCVEGEMEFTVFADPKFDIEADQTLIVKKDQCAIAAPQAPHKIAANTDDMKFYVEFWKIPDATN
eukprot:283046_1